MRMLSVALLVATGCASTEAQKQPDPPPTQPASPPAQKKPTKAELDAAAARAQAAMAQLQRAQAAAAEAVKKCPAVDAALSPEELEKLSAETRAAQEQAKGPLLPANAYVNDLGRKLAARSTMPTLAWSFRIAASEAVETYSTPGGDVVISAGAVRLLDNEAQLAALLAHEIAHVANGDLRKTYGKVRHEVCVPAATAEAYAAEGLADAAPAQPANLQQSLVAGVLKLHATLGAGKDVELAADRVGFDLLAQGGYETLEFDRVLAKLDKAGLVVAAHPSAADRTAQWVELRSKAPKTKGKTPPLPAALKRDLPKK